MNQKAENVKALLLRTALATLCSLLMLPVLYAQPLGVGQWREHLPYGYTLMLAEGDNQIWCATPYSLFYFDKDDNSINRLSKINGLSDIGISSIAYNTKNKTLVVAYQNANIDLISEKGVHNINDIRRKTMPGNKTINRITEKGDSMLLSCGFGIVILDVKRSEIRDTWFIGPNGGQVNVTDLDFSDSLIYAATTNGLYFANANDPFLVSFTQWQKDTTLPHPNASYNLIEWFGDAFFANNNNPSYYSDTLYVRSNGSWTAFDTANTASRINMRQMGSYLYITVVDGVHILNDVFQRHFTIYTYNPGHPAPMDAIVDKDNIRWIADKQKGLVKSPNDWVFEFFNMDGPYRANVFRVAASDNSVWIASGGVSTSWGNEWRREGISAMMDEKWFSFTAENTSALDTTVDYLEPVINPFDENIVFMGTWGRGLLEFRNKQLYKVHSPHNSTLPFSINDNKWFGVAGMTYDKDGNLWCVSSVNPMALHRLTPAGVWKAFSLSPFVTEEVLTGIVIDDYGQKWISLGRSQGIIVYDDNGTPDNASDDRKKRLDAQVGSGQLPSTTVNCLALDQDGEIWVGTDKGIAVFYNPGNVFSNQNFDAQRIFIEQDGVTQYLLEQENVTSIAVDGGNRKWITTQKAGVFLMSEDGTRQLAHFTTENSPLLSNQVNSVAINHRTGEVFFGTDMGLISYRGMATRGNEKHSDVLVFPNPVRENYNGYISIRGLVASADVRITDVAGGLVYSTKAQGGQAVWNGKNFSGQKVSTGVYLVFSTNSDGTETLVSKILFVK